MTRRYNDAQSQILNEWIVANHGILGPTDMGRILKLSRGAVNLRLKKLELPNLSMAERSAMSYRARRPALRSMEREELLDQAGVKWSWGDLA